MSTTNNTISAKATTMTPNGINHFERRQDLIQYYDGPIVSEYISQRCRELHTENYGKDRFEDNYCTESVKDSNN